MLKFMALVVVLLQGISPVVGLRVWAGDCGSPAERSATGCCATDSGECCCATALAGCACGDETPRPAPVVVEFPAAPQVLAPAAGGRIAFPFRAALRSPRPTLHDGAHGAFEHRTLLEILAFSCVWMT